MSASQIKLSVDDPGVFHSPSVNSEFAVQASELLQENHDKNHIFYESGFHSTSRSPYWQSRPSAKLLQHLFKSFL